MTSHTPARFLILIEDDFELMGDGLGDVESLQRRPALALMDAARDCGATLTFMVDVAQQLAFYRHEDPRLRDQRRLWDDTVRQMKQRGFDVQLHLHPQWMGARFEGGAFALDDRWNLAAYAPAEQRQLVAEASRYLAKLLGPLDPSYRVLGFKAGSWGLQPSAPLLKILAAAGIRVVMGVREGMRIPGLGVDYTHLDEARRPYHPDYTDITRLAAEPNELVVLPLQPYAPGPVAMAGLAAGTFARRLGGLGGLGGRVRRPDPEAGKRRFVVSPRPYRTHLKLGEQPFPYLRRSFDETLERLSELEADRIPVVIESHTKQLSDPGAARRFLAHIAEHPDVEFGTLTSYVAELDRGEATVRTGP